jgi:hypothetical protein
MYGGAPGVPEEGYMPTPDEMKKFLEEDLSHALKELFVGAVVWEAADVEKGRSELCPFQRDLAMYASFVQARALYEFYSQKKKRKAKKGQGQDDARARDFIPTGKWTGKGSKSKLYSKYMDNDAPANKRVFHLVYGRSRQAGGPINDETRHIKNQVLAFARELLKFTREFGNRVEPDFRGSARCALGKALKAAEEAANGCKITNPLL